MLDSKFAEHTGWARNEILVRPAAAEVACCSAFVSKGGSCDTTESPSMTQATRSASPMTDLSRTWHTSKCRNRNNMTSLSKSDCSERSRSRKRPLPSLMSAVSILLAARMTPAECFSGVISPTLPWSISAGSAVWSANTALHFRNHGGQHNDAFFAETVMPTEALLRTPNSFGIASATARPQMPTWLSIPQSHLAEANKWGLQKSLRESFFSENDILRVMLAIEEAANGDRNKVAGAAEFCLLLTETMELGFDALVAAAFHYCCCVSAREQAAASSGDAAHNQFAALASNYGMQTVSPRLEAFGQNAVSMARDAARLKQLELVAAAVMQFEGRNGRVTPDTRDAENLKKLLLSETHDWRALAIRSAACLYRMRGILKTGPVTLTKEANRVAREALNIYAPLASRLGMHRLKNELEGTAFRILYRRQYEKVTQLANLTTLKSSSASARSTSSADEKSADAMQQVLDRVKDEMVTLLKNDAEFSALVRDFSVTSRVKEPYSLWRKMLKRGYKSVVQVPDALALRIVLDAKKMSPHEPTEITRARERALCYYAQQLCTQHWKPVPGKERFKDYIDNPKENGYQSLHYTAKTEYLGQEWSLEIQVRSGEMHQVAEYGLASHWDYKAAHENAKSKDFDHEDHSSEAYIRNVQEWHWQQHGGAPTPAEWDATSVSAGAMYDIWQFRRRTDRIRARTKRLEPYIQALTVAQSDLTRDYVFVFLQQSPDKACASEGKVLALPSGACVLDALRAGEKSMGFPLQYIVDDELALNGGSTSITRQLHNGDVLTIPIASQRTLARSP